MMGSTAWVFPGVFGGLVGGVCCMIGAVAVGLGLAGASFASTVMDRYQVWAMAASLVVLVVGLARSLRATRAGAGQARVDLRRAGRMLVRHAAVMGATYAITLLAVVALSRLVVNG
jgi:hypothetical protein